MVLAFGSTIELLPRAVSGWAYDTYRPTNLGLAHVEVAGTDGAAGHAPRRGSRAAAAVHVPRCARLTALRPRL